MKVKINVKNANQYIENIENRLRIANILKILHENM